LSVESSIIPIADVIFEHRLYLPSVGFVIAVMAGVMWIWNRMEDKSFGKKVVPVVMVLIILGLSATTYARNTVWQDEVTLWEDTVKKSPEKARPLYNFHDSRGRFYIYRESFDDAIKEFQMAIKINPFFADAHNNLGLIYLRQGRIDEATKEIQNALALEPNSGYIRDSLGQIYLAQGRNEEAKRAFQSALKLDPNCAEARDNLNKVREITKNSGKR
jgi:protein O-mannosyl-transferase